MENFDQKNLRKDEGFYGSSNLQIACDDNDIMDLTGSTGNLTLKETPIENPSVLKLKQQAKILDSTFFNEAFPSTHNEKKVVSSPLRYILFDSENEEDIEMNIIKDKETEFSESVDSQIQKTQYIHDSVIKQGFILLQQKDGTCESKFLVLTEKFLVFRNDNYTKDLTDGLDSGHVVLLPEIISVLQDTKNNEYQVIKTYFTTWTFKINMEGDMNSKNYTLDWVRAIDFTRKKAWQRLLKVESKNQQIVPQERQLEIQYGQSFDNEFEIVQYVGKGSYSFVHMVRKKNNNNRLFIAKFCSKRLNKRWINIATKRIDSSLDSKHGLSFNPESVNPLLVPIEVYFLFLVKWDLSIKVGLPFLEAIYTSPQSEYYIVVMPSSLIQGYDVKIPKSVTLEQPDVTDLFSLVELFSPGTFPAIWAQGIFKQLLQAIFILHTQCNFIHGDIKDENVIIGLISESNVTKSSLAELDSSNEIWKAVLIDFGSALPFQRIPMSSLNLIRKYHLHDEYSRFEKLNSFGGTFKYASPEIVLQYHPELAQIEHGFYPPPQDVWALAIVLFIMLFGFEPFENDMEVIQGDWKQKLNIVTDEKKKKYYMRTNDVLESGQYEEVAEEWIVLLEGMFKTSWYERWTIEEVLDYSQKYLNIIN